MKPTCTPGIIENSLSSIQAITTQQTRPKRIQPSYNTAYSWGERGDVEITALMCKINKNNNAQRPQLASGWQTKSRTGDNLIPNP